MDAPQSPQPPPPANQPSDRAVLEFLAWRCDRLHTLFQFALAGLIILSVAVNAFLFKQMRLVRLQLPAQRDATVRYLMDFQKRDDPTIRSFVMRLQNFAVTNADFQPILDQYRMPLSGYLLPVPQKTVPPAPPAKTNASRK